MDGKWIKHLIIGNILNLEKCPTILLQTLEILIFHPSSITYPQKKLHLYNFKQKKQFKSQLIFQHSAFKRGNQSKFILIQRTKNKKEKQELLRQLENNDILKSIFGSIAFTQQQKQILSMMYSYKLVVIQKHRSLKQKLLQLTECIKSNRNKKIGEIEGFLQDEIKLELQSLRKFSKSIDMFLTETVLDREKQLKKNQQNQGQNLPQSLKVDKKQNQQKQFQQNNQQKYGQNNKAQNNSKVNDQQCYQTKNYQRIGPSHGYMIQLSGSSVESTENFLFNYHQLYLQNSSINIEAQNHNSHPVLNQTSQQQQFIQTTRMNNQNHLGISVEMLAYQKQPSLLFMPLPFYNRSTGSEFFDWPHPMQQNFSQKQNLPKQEQKSLIQAKKPKLTCKNRKSSQYQISGKTVNINDGRKQENRHQQESEISFMNDE